MNGSSLITIVILNLRIITKCYKQIVFGVIDLSVLNSFILYEDSLRTMP